MNKYLLTIIFVISNIIVGFATHIIGGDFSYACTSQDNYSFTLTMYRDCQSQGAAFDSAPNAFTVGTVTIFNGSPVPMQIVELDAPSIEEIDAEAANPCAEIPPNVCVERGIYYFNLNLPASTEPYHVVYQRCCRNPTITNIELPDEQGMTFVLEITPDAQQLCNSSPAFADFPPPVICVGEPMNFDHSAQDPDGDQLIYSFCNPLNGGSPMAPAPDPDDPPPYELVDFIAPFYSATNPIGGNPVVSINNTTGLITGTPEVEGQFVVGVCVSEFRNGVLLSKIQRDFQFNVTGCNPIIDANLGLAVAPDLNAQTVDLCGELDVAILNQSQIEANIDEYYWEIQLPGNVLTFDTRHINFTLPDYGFYTGKMVLNPGSQCKDSLDFIIRASPPLVADITAVYDTCEVGPVQYLDVSPLTDPNFPIVDYNWNLDDGFASTDKFPEVQYDNPGVKTISLVFEDTIGCTATALSSVAWQPAPEIVIIEPSEDEVCPGTNILFNNESFPIDDSYTLNWNFGDGNFANGVNTANVYTEPGYYSLALEIISPIGCYKTDTFTNLIYVDSLPVADFNIELPEDFNIDNPTVTLIEDAQRAVGWDWLLPDGSPMYGPESMYTFQDTGYHTIGLVVQHAFGCYDTIYQSIDVAPVNEIHFPNAFTPNDDGLNDFWGPRGNRMAQFENYSVHIFDRWGSRVFSADNPFDYWYGGHNGRPALEGSYSYVLTYKLPRQPAVKEEGMIVLMR